MPKFDSNRPSQKGAWVYAIETEDGRFVKIGRSRDVIRRLYELQTGNPGLRLLGVTPERSGVSELDIHASLAGDHHEGEWFHNSPRVGEFIRGLQHMSLPSRNPRPAIRNRRAGPASKFISEIEDIALSLPKHVPVGNGKTVDRAEACYEDLKRYRKVLNQEFRERHKKRIAAVTALMELWPPRTKKLQGTTLAQVDAEKARRAGLI